MIVATGAATTIASAAISDSPVRYNRDIRPILSDNCFACHGPDASKREAGLRLDEPVAASRLLDSGNAAIVPGKPEAGSLLARIVSTDEDAIMPPTASHKKLTDHQKALLKTWIEQGAVYEDHWSFQALQPVAIPTSASIPNLTQELLEWPRNPIDWFVLQKLSENGLQPSPIAEPKTLARRLSLDLLGLPPSTEFLTNFHLSDIDSTISKLLQSPHYGERMAVDWLDAARFADTQGYQVDRDQDMHLWRDWVIQAFNSKMPFDQFTIEQLAGDLLPNATVSQRIATGFHRNHMVNQEGGIIPAEFIAEYTADRVETTATVWMGQTFNCCRCHDHKFDPFTQADFYRLKAFFNQVGEQGEGGQDSLAMATPEIEQKLKPLNAQMKKLQDELNRQPAVAEAVQAWANRLVQQPLSWSRLEIESIQAKQGRPKIAGDRKSFDLARVNRETAPLEIAIKLPPNSTLNALRIQCSSETDATVVIRKAFLKRGATKIELVGAEEGPSQPAVEAVRVLKENLRVNVTLSPGPNKPPQGLVWELENPLTCNDVNEPCVLSLVVTSSNKPTEWEVLFTDGPSDQLVTEEIRELATKDINQRSKSERELLEDRYRLSQPEAKALRSKIDDLRERVPTLRSQQPTVMVMSERDKPKEAFILMRGVYDKPGEKVEAGTPSILPPLPENAPRNRLGLARWLVSPEHPLTARVTINRLWQSIFGSGLVRTSEDFGSQGEAPSHPELLDWLAGEFIRSGWNIQHIQRLILTSATYQQSSRFRPEHLTLDPENRWLARGPRFRLQAEFVRDQSLFVAGLLSTKIGGKSVKPYHPTGLYELVTAGTGTTIYVEDKGESLFRRSLYTYWKRSVPHPAMMIFDATGREVCSVRRPRSNTPLQSLNLMNDPTYIEAARNLAARMLDASDVLSEQIQFGYSCLLARDATKAELSILMRAFERAKKDFEANPEATLGLLKTGTTKPAEHHSEASLAAMTSLANTLLCLDETITKE